LENTGFPDQIYALLAETVLGGMDISFHLVWSKSSLGLYPTANQNAGKMKCVVIGCGLQASLDMLMRLKCNRTNKCMCRW